MPLRKEAVFLCQKMAKKDKKKKSKKKEESIVLKPKKVTLSESERLAKYESEWQDCDSALSSLREEWRDNEKVFFNSDKGKIADETKSDVNDGHLSTAVIQRTQRIMAQPPTGKVDYLDIKDRGKNMLLNLSLQKYVIPNANSQFRHLTKLKLVSMYSQIYGKQPVLKFYSVTDDYVGPDFQIIPIDKYYPQPGVFQDSDQDYCFVDTLMTVGQIKNLPKSTWKNIDELLVKVKEKKAKVNYVNKTSNELEYGIDFEGVLFRTKYERDKWTTWAPDFSEIGILREVENKNGKLPISVKQTIPLLDRATGWSDTERSKSLQLTQNSLASLTLDSIKYKLFPITIVNPAMVIKSTLQRKAGAIWEEKTMGSIRPYNESMQDINVFNNMSGYITSTLNNQLGTSDMSASKSVDSTMGKTPQALQMQQQKESAADSWERQSMEEFVEELYDSFIDMLAENQPKPIDLDLMAGEIEQIAQMYPDVKEMYDESNGRLTLKPGALKGKYKFFIDSGTTVQKDSVNENRNLTSIIQLVMSNPTIRQEMQAKGKDIDLAELIKRFVITSGTKDADKIIVDYKPPMQPQLGMEDPMAQLDGQQMPMNPQEQMTSPQPPQQTIPQQPIQQPQGQGNSQQLMSQISDPQILAAAQSLFK